MTQTILPPEIDGGVINVNTIEHKKQAERKILNLIRSFENITGYKVEGIIWYNNKPILDVAIKE